MAEKPYEVTAPTSVLGHAPGEEFTDDLDPVLEARLLASGALKIKTAPAPAPKVVVPKLVKPDPSE